MLQIHVANNRRKRVGNILRDRSNVIHRIRAKDDIWFFRSYRLTKSVFYQFLEILEPYIETQNKNMAILSSDD